MSMPLFVFGSLKDPDVLEVVLGRAPGDIECVPAKLRGYRVARLPDESYPVLTESPGGIADGLLLKDLGQEDLDRIAFFENYEYTFRRCVVEELPAAREVEALYCDEGETASGPREAWSLEEWQRAHKRGFIEDTRRYMQLYGRMSAEEADAQWMKWKNR